MFGIFKKKPLLDDNNRTWQFETYHWLLENFGGQDFWEKTDLIVPDSQHFPDKAKSPEERVKKIFSRVKEYALMDKYPCRLVQQEADMNTDIAPLLQIKNAPRNPAGTFSGNSREILITYNPEFINQPVLLISTFAHELAHYLTIYAKEAPPGGWDNCERVTDLAAIFMGFGIFLSNSAINFSQFTTAGVQGWQSQRLGYLSELELVYGLAIFAKLKAIETKLVKVHLKSSLWGTFKKAFNELDLYSDEIDELKKVKLRNVNIKSKKKSIKRKKR